MTYRKKIVVCNRCEGKGTYYHVPDPADFRDGSDSFSHPTCEKCKGSGLTLVTTNVTEEPYVPGKTY